eukprot:TRINITY_DN67314_c5_g1_i16.p1 TRINITY_DN67314_c5_g1~~TRINITY_DN67314_c5_g1_i16.p1  ORF type:complete len:416 (-),score=8.64 TRINITY_DN67314_c5_g1_i16:20-1267(-)
MAPPRQPLLLRIRNGTVGISVALAAQAVLYKHMWKYPPISTFHMPEWPVIFFELSSSLTLLLILALLIARVIFWPHSFTVEFDNPYRTNLFLIPTLVLCLLLLGLPTGAAHILNKGTALTVTTVVLLLEIILYGRWLRLKSHSLRDGVNPAYLVTTLGNILAAIILKRTDCPEFAMLCFVVGVLFWVFVLLSALQTPSVHEPDHTGSVRLVHAHQAMHVLFIAPPAVLAIAWFHLNDMQVDIGFRIFFFSALAFLFLIVPNCLPSTIRAGFNIMWWAFTFPLTAFGTAALIYLVEIRNTVLSTITFIYCLSTTVLVVIILLISVWVQVTRWKEGGIFPDDPLQEWAMEQPTDPESGTVENTSLTPLNLMGHVSVENGTAMVALASPASTSDVVPLIGTALSPCSRHSQSDEVGLL